MNFELYEEIWIIDVCVHLGYRWKLKLMKWIRLPGGEMLKQEPGSRWIHVKIQWQVEDEPAEYQKC